MATHLLALLAVQLVLLLGTGRENSWTPDDGAYALQIRTLERTGGWAFPYQHDDIDPDLAHLPFTHGTITEDRAAFPYVKHPVWIAVLRGSSALFGDVVGLALPSALGVVAAAAVAGRLTRRFDPAAVPWAVWAVGLSGLLISGTALWAHSATAALIGLCIAPVLDAVAGGWRRRSAVVLALALGAATSIRGEALLFAAATLMVLALMTVIRPGPLVDRIRSMGWLVALPAAVVLLVRFANAAAVGAILDEADGPSSPTLASGSLGPSGGLTGRVEAMQRTLIDGLGLSSSGTALAVVAVCAFGAGGVALARRRPRAGAFGIVVGLVFSSVRTLLVAPGDYAGFLIATPLVLVATPTIARSCRGWSSRAVGAILLLFTVAVLAVQYPEGGSHDWGGRFLLPLVVPTLVAGVVALRRLVAGTGEDSRRLLAMALVATVVVPSLLGLSATQGFRDGSGAMTDRAVATGADVVVRVPAYQSRLSWKAIAEGDWMAADPGDVEDLLATLGRASAGSVAVLGAGADDLSPPPGYDKEVLAGDLAVFTPTR